MGSHLGKSSDSLDHRFRAFHELMARKVRDILLVSSLYDACIIEEDCRLAERIINEYRGLNLSQPPRVTWVSTAEEALDMLETRNFDLVMTMPRVVDMDALALGSEIKRRRPELPVVLMTHAAVADATEFNLQELSGIDRIMVWSGNSDLLLAQIKNIEDQLNVLHDTEVAGVRVILLVEDSPVYLSSILPILYRELVSQTQAVMGEGLNEEHRLLTMRARPKVLVAQNYEEAEYLFQEFKPYLLGVISDTRFPRAGKLDDDAGSDFLRLVKQSVPDMPTLLTSSEPGNSAKAEEVQAVFANKNSATLHREIRSFLLDHLGFGNFVFRMPDGTEVMRASSWKAMEEALPNIPDECFMYHWSRNDFSRWLFARTETTLASKLRPFTSDDFKDDVNVMRQFLITSLKERRRGRQSGVVVDFDPAYVDPDLDFLKIGTGSLGGKARGLVFMTTLLKRNPDLKDKFPGVEIGVPKTLVVTTSTFDRMVEDGDLRELGKVDLPDDDIADRFLDTPFPADVTDALRAFLQSADYPLAVRSSGLLEDAQNRAYAGLYRTYMIPNDHPQLEVRLANLVKAIKLVYASTYCRGPKAFARRVGLRTEEERMAVIIQQLVGRAYGPYYYPAVSGVAQSHNYYPIFRMKQEDGLATIALGLGKTVVEGGQSLRFSPRHPRLLPQFSLVSDILSNAQREFWSLRLDGSVPRLKLDDSATLELRRVTDAAGEDPVRLLASTYLAEEERLTDSPLAKGPKLITFANVLQHNAFPLADILSTLIDMLHEGMGSPVEMEFSLDLCPPPGQKPFLALLQVRPMTARAEMAEVNITAEEEAQAFCCSGNALGNTSRRDMTDILFVRPDNFDPSRTPEIARQISRFNSSLAADKTPYLLVGPGRWGSADRWLGIPVVWGDISGVGAIVETYLPNLKAEPSQGSHFFHNVTTLGINYLTVGENGDDRLDWDWLSSLPRIGETDFLAHVRLTEPFTLKVDGRNSRGVAYAGIMNGKGV